MSRHYYLGPWVFDESDPLAPFYRAPDGCVGLLDFRAADLSGVGFFAFNDDRGLGSDYEEFGDGINRVEDAAMPPADRSRWSSILGIGAVAGPSLLDVLRDTFDLYGDPDGEIICPPRTPTHKRLLNLWLGGHSRVHSERWRDTSHRSWPRVQALLQRNYRKIRTQAKADESVIRGLRQGQRPDQPGYTRGMHDRIERERGRNGRSFNEQRDALALYVGETHQRWMQCQMWKYHCLETDVRPSDLPNEPPRRPDTEYTESWPTDGTTVSSGQDLTWAEVNGNVEVSSGRIQAVSAAVREAARAEHDLSSDDHHAKHLFYGLDGGADDESGTTVRFSPSAQTNYEGTARRNDILQLRRYSSGGITGLWASASYRGQLGDGNSVTTDATGSDISIELNDVSQQTVTDTNITGNVRCGVAVGSSGRGDTWEAADAVAAGNRRRRVIGGSS